MRKRLAAELSAHPAQSPQAAAVHPEDAQPKAAHEPQHPGERQAKTVKWAQASLSVLLGLRLPLDGVLGATTQMAIRRFQTQSGLPQSGALDETTVLALAKAIGHPAPGMTAEHKVMPRWFRLERQAPKPRPQLKKPREPDAPQPETHAELAKPREAVKPVLSEEAPHKKRRVDAARDEELP